MVRGVAADMTSQGTHMRQMGADDMSSQGSYLKKVGGFDDMQSQGSYMVRGYNGPSDGKHLFNADDDGSDLAMLRQSQFTDKDKLNESAVDHGSLYSSTMEAGGKDTLEVDDPEHKGNSAQQPSE